MQAISSNRQWKKNKEQFAAMNPMISLFGRSNNWTLPLWEGIFFYRLFGFFNSILKLSYCVCLWTILFWCLNKKFTMMNVIWVLLRDQLVILVEALLFSCAVLSLSSGKINENGQAKPLKWVASLEINLRKLRIVPGCSDIKI